MSFHLLLGMGIGLITIIPPGPITVTLLHIGARNGTGAALRGGAGVAAGDTLVIAASVAIVTAGTALPTAVFAGTRALGIGLLIALGIAMVAMPNKCESTLGRIERPGRTLFLATTFTPTALGSWVALLASMPFAAEPAVLVAFAAGIVIATALWHPILGLASGRVGSRISRSAQRRITRLGGLAMIALGIAIAR